ncbi:MAG: peptidylprolyl isomerase [Calditrichia bacterium]
MKKFVRLFFVLNLLVIWISGCHRETIPPGDIVARVGGEYLTRQEVLAAIPENTPEPEKTDLVRHIVDKWVRYTALSLEAKEAGMDLTDYQKYSLALLEKQYLADQFIEKNFPINVTVTEKEISEYYEANKNEFVRENDEVHLVQLFMEKLDRAIDREIKQSKNLLEIITKNLLDKSPNRLIQPNGDLGYIAITDFAPVIQERVKQGIVGKIYGPLKIEKGYYYFQILDKQKKNSIRELELVKDTIKERLEYVKRYKKINSETDKILKKYNAEVYPEHIN